jgi:hypothetical protein
MFRSACDRNLLVFPEVVDCVNYIRAANHKMTSLLAFVYLANFILIRMFSSVCSS